MNRFLDRLAELYAPLGQRGLLMDGQYRFADRPAGEPAPGGSALARDGSSRQGRSRASALPHNALAHKPHAF